MTPTYLRGNGAGISPFGSPTAAGTGAYLPVQIRHAYGFDSIVFGSVVGDGTGQTIAIVDAFDNPKFVSSSSPTFNTSDLHLFDVGLGIPDPPSFIKVNQSGGTSYPGTDVGWGTEIALDVEWAHAIAPNANIILVEANDPSSANLFAAVTYARSVATVVSMSWGGNESAGETSFDGTFSKSGVTFLASTGDSGAPGSYPAYSPNVVAVGGTVLSASSPAGNYISETGWSGSGGGISSFENKPSYQSAITLSATKRMIPDVSLEAGSGVAIYDSFSQGATPPWVSVFGTSFSAPAWAGLIAIANQARATAGLGTLTGNSATLPKLYSMAATNFHDITSGNNGFTALVGYDLVTGRGTPFADRVVNDLVDDTKAPTAAGTFANVTTAGSTTYTINITYTDNYSLNVGTLDNNDIRVTGPGGYNVLATFVSSTPSGNGTPRTATYSITPPGGSWDPTDVGTYTVSIVASQVADTHGNFVAAGALGTFTVALGPVTWVVLNTNDSGAGSLRQAIADANSNAPAIDTITFDGTVFNTAKTINLLSTLTISDGVVVQGPGVGLVNITGGGDSIVFISIAAGTKSVSISGVTLSNGKSTDRGGAIEDFNAALTLDTVVITNCQAVNGGGAIHIAGGSVASLTLLNSTLSNNSVTGASGIGGAIDAGFNSDLVIQSSTLSGNTAGGNGGAIGFDNNGSISLVSSSMSGNSSGLTGGAIWFTGNVRPAGFTLRNTTVAGNVAAFAGGGLYFYTLTGQATIQNCTIASNAVTSGSGGGISFAQITAGAINLESTIVAKNTALTASDLEVATPVNAKNCLIGVGNDGFVFGTNSGNMVGTSLAPLDPQLGPLVNNGGPTQTMALIGSSPAYNAGSNPASLSMDQRGNARVFGSAADIGAYESQFAPVHVTSITINNGAIQRSEVRWITVTFDGIVTLPVNAADAFSLVRTSPSPATVTLNVDTSGSAVTTVAKLTFTGGSIDGPSLADGLYTLTVLGSQITGPGNLNIDGDNDGTLGGNASVNLHRLFGDADGNRVVDGLDFAAFRSSFGSATDFTFDFNGDGIIDGLDFGAFRGHFAATI